MGSLLNGRVEMSSSLTSLRKAVAICMALWALFLSLKALLDQHGLDHCISQQGERGEKGTKPKPLFASIIGLETFLS